MSPIQVFLTSGLVFLAMYMYVRIRNSVLDALLIFLFLGVSIFFVLFPDATNTLAKMVGVARGANLIFYIGFLFLFFLILKLYAKNKRLEQNLTELTRQISLQNAEDLSDKKS